MSDAVNIFKFLVIVRVIKILPMLYEVKSMRLIIETMRNMFVPMSTVTVLLGVIFYIFAQLGMFMFGGKL